MDKRGEWTVWTAGLIAILAGHPQLGGYLWAGLLVAVSVRWALTTERRRQ